LNTHIFATAVNCMDGRTQLPVIEWLKHQYCIDYVDMITEAGPERLLAEGINKQIVRSIRNRIEVSVYKHNSMLIAIVGHHDCIGNPTGREVKGKQIQSATNVIKSWNLTNNVIGLWVGENWEVNEVPQD
jgi:hypothetical protein